jgi:hypothetical protein
VRVPGFLRNLEVFHPQAYVSFRNQDAAGNSVARERYVGRRDGTLRT